MNKHTFELDLLATTRNKKLLFTKSCSSCRISLFSIFAAHLPAIARIKGNELTKPNVRALDSNLSGSEYHMQMQ